MISEMSELVGFIGAIYFTMTVDNLLFKRFWTPDLYGLIKTSLKKFDFTLSTPLKESLLLSVQSNSKAVEMRARYRGAYFLCFSIFLLIYGSFESSIDYTVGYVILLLFIIVISILISIFGIFNWTRLKDLIVSISILPIIYMIGYCVISIDSVAVFFDNNLGSAIGVLSRICKLSIILILFIPILSRLFINWLNSNIYTDFLVKNLNSEYLKYKSTEEGIASKDERKCSPEYDHVFKRIYLSDSMSSDEVMTEFKNTLINRLKVIFTPKSWWDLVLFSFSLEHKTPLPETIKTDGVYPLPESDKNSYEMHCQIFSKMRDITIKEYCKKNYIDEYKFRNFRREWLKSKGKSKKT